MISVRSDVKKATKALTKAERKIIPAATSSALNKTATTVRRKILKEVSVSTGALQKDLKNNAYIIKSNQRKLWATIVGRPNLIALAKTGRPKQTPRGAAAGRGPRRRVYKNTFVATMKSGHEGIFIRKRKTRLPIRELFVASVSREMSETLRKVISQLGEKRFLEIFPHELQYRLSRLRK